jgi:2-keto-4-pentenoate hydratase/2-oxohepta-3-ene-1,7-dioic acid hydratase in catechol pathway
MTIKEEVIKYWTDVYNYANRAREEANEEARKQTSIMFKAERKIKEAHRSKYYQIGE